MLWMIMPDLMLDKINSPVLSSLYWVTMLWCWDGEHWDFLWMNCYFWWCCGFNLSVVACLLRIGLQHHFWSVFACEWLWFGGCNGCHMSWLPHLRLGNTKWGMRFFFCPSLARQTTFLDESLPGRHKNNIFHNNLNGQLKQQLHTLWKVKTSCNLQGSTLFSIMLFESLIKRRIQKLDLFSKSHII